MNERSLELYWNYIPEGQENACTYETLCQTWNCDERTARRILQCLSCYDDGSDFVLIRSARGKGFYKTEDHNTIQAYRKECLEKGRSVLAPLRKINRVLAEEPNQYRFENNLRLVRLSRNLTLTDVVEKMKSVDPAFDKPMMSKMENDRCMPTYIQLLKLSEIYGCSPDDLIKTDLFEE